MKMKSIRIIFTAILFVLCMVNAYSQIFKSKSAIVEDLKENGFEYEENVLSTGEEYISWDRNQAADGEDFISLKACFFIELDDGDQVCHKWQILEPASQINRFVSSFREAELVEVDRLTWKDYETEIIYRVELNEDRDICFVAAWYDMKEEY